MKLANLPFRAFSKLKRMYISMVGVLFGVNSKVYWDKRFNSNWERMNGRLQSCLFASGFVLTNFAKKITPASVLDFGCGLADSIPVLNMAYPKAKLYYYDFSTVAMSKAKESYSALAEGYDLTRKTTFEMVYSSNVIEHIMDEQLTEFCSQLISLASKYVVIQAPYNELLADGSKIDAGKKSTVVEHVRTLDEDFLNFLKVNYTNFNWDMEIKNIPIAWPFGSQIFYVGVSKSTH